MPDPLPLRPGEPGRTLHQACVEVFRVRRYSRRTQESYLSWIARFIRFCGGRHPLELDELDVTRFLTHLAVERKVAASTQSQALCALLFLYQDVLERPLGELVDLVRVRKPKKLPVVMTPEECALVLDLMTGVPRLVCQLIYGAGPRLLEALELRVKDVDFGRRLITVRSGKGDRDRTTMLPVSVIEDLRAHLVVVKRQHEDDLREGRGRVPLPYALARKYPRADREWCWQRVFPATKHYADRETGIEYRHHLHESVVQKAMRDAVVRSGITKKVGPHTFRHSFATHLMDNGYNIRQIQKLLGHQSVTTTQIYVHVMNEGGLGVRSPLDTPPAGSYADREGFLKKPRKVRPIGLSAGEGQFPSDRGPNGPESYADQDDD